jgi:TATA-binding protein-associated factor
MPNYLGSDIEFSSRFGKDICRGQLPGASTEDIQRGLHKLRQLHQQVLPFILRREKNQVLNELPPKTITLIPCELSPIQSRLYRYLSSNQEVKNTLLNVDRILENPIESGYDETKINMVHKTDLSALHNLRLICTHPSLLSEKETAFVKNSDDMSNIECSGKLLALNDLLRSAQIVPSEVTGADNDESLLYINEDASSGLYDNGSGLDFSDDFNKETGELPSVESPRVCRKCLIYSQFRQSLDAVEEFLFKYQMPSLKYLRIDGSVEAHKRTAIVQRFNDDDDIQCLLLTTKVGGLGLNLQAASIVIFLENDWNPHSDLQAMDRAHRLGQSKVRVFSQYPPHPLSLELIILFSV